MLRLLLDTNIVLDCLVFRDPATRPLWAAVESKGVEVLSHPLALEELSRVLAYPQCRVDEEVQLDIWARYAERTSLIAVPDGFSRENLSLPPEFPRCRDRDDDLFLALAYHSGADALISKDRDLLKLRRKVRKFGVTILGRAEVDHLLGVRNDGDASK
jgi:putative PIN family toxin of toxin-antitoxin system